MTTYCMKCPRCGGQLVVESTELAEVCGPCLIRDGEVVKLARDYRAENFGVGAGVRVSKTGTLREQRDLFLPTARELAGPGDPDGAKGLKAWNENHQPRPTNSKPLRPDRPPGSKEVF